MAKTGTQYGDEVRELRAAGFDFPASRGYLLANPNDWSSGQKGAVTRAFNSLDEERDADTAPDQGLTDDEIEGFFEDGAGDNDEAWDDIDYFDFDEADELQDDEADDYDEAD